MADIPKLTLRDLTEMARSHERIAMVTAYDASSARLADRAGVDIVLVGDSAAMTVLGHESTIPVTLDEMLMLTRAVTRVVEHAFVVADMPFGSYQPGEDEALESAIRFVKEAGADAVKLEGRGPHADAHRLDPGRRHPRDGTRRPDAAVGDARSTATRRAAGRPPRRAASSTKRGRSSARAVSPSCSRPSRPPSPRTSPTRCGSRPSGSAPARRATARSSCGTICSASRRDTCRASSSRTRISKATIARGARGVRRRRDERRLSRPPNTPTGCRMRSLRGSRLSLPEAYQTGDFTKPFREPEEVIGVERQRLVPKSLISESSNRRIGIRIQRFCDSRLVIRTSDYGVACLD